jgi:hypothetical protein
LVEAQSIITYCTTWVYKLYCSYARAPEKKKRSGGGLVKPCGLSEELQAILGERELSRIQVPL